MVQCTVMKIWCSAVYRGVVKLRALQNSEMKLLIWPGSGLMGHGYITIGFDSTDTEVSWLVLHLVTFDYGSHGNVWSPFTLSFTHLVNESEIKGVQKGSC